MYRLNCHLTDVALRKESVDRNLLSLILLTMFILSLSARRAWIEIYFLHSHRPLRWVALRKESVDRNNVMFSVFASPFSSLSARRAWIEISYDGR